MSEIEETEEQKKERLRRELEGKNIQHYMALATAWITTKMEVDKTIINLSAGAIGLLITILTTKGTAADWQIWLFIIAFVGYIIAIVTSITIFQQNSVRIEQELQQNDEHDFKLKRLDLLARWSFIIGTISFVLIGISSALNLKCSKAANSQSEQKNLEKQHVVEREKPSEAERNFSNSIYITNNARPPTSNMPAKRTKAQSNNIIQDYYSSSCRERPKVK